jgi:hypothetical protein
LFIRLVGRRIRSRTPFALDFRALAKSTSQKRFLIRVCPGRS